MTPNVIYAFASYNSQVVMFLQNEPINLEYVRTDGGPYVFSEFLRYMWKQAEPFVLIEHDVLPYPGAIQEIWDCPEEFCGKPYRIATFEAACFGCTYFGSELMTQYPDAMEEAARRDPVWSCLDHRLADVLAESGRKGDQNPGDGSWGWPHQHGPSVQHLRLY